MVSKTDNSSSELKIEVLDNVIFTEIGIHNNERGGVLVDGFKGHSTDDVKKYVKSFKSNGDVYYSYELCSFLIMAGWITPKSQPIDAFVAKVFKGLLLGGPTQNISIFHIPSYPTNFSQTSGITPNIIS